MLASCFHAKGLHQPQWPPFQKPLYVLAAKQRNVVAEPFAKRCVQPVPVCCFLLAHVFEHSCRRRIRFAQLVRKFAENPSIFFFVLNRQRQDFALAQILEFLQHSFPLRVLPRRKNRTTLPSKSSKCAPPSLSGRVPICV